MMGKRDYLTSQYETPGKLTTGFLGENYKNRKGSDLAEMT
jgi:hypothetical protein